MKPMIKTLYIFVIITFTFSYLDAPSAKDYDPIQTALALNYSQMSICRMVTYNDKVVLDQEYDNIINNINLSKIEDKEIIQLLLSLMDSLTKSKLVAGDKEWLQKEYEKKVETAVYDTFTNSAGLAAGVAGAALTGNFVGAANNLTQVGMQYFNYQKVLEENKEQLDRTKWQLEKDTLNFLNYQRKKILKISWELIKRYELPDEWRLTEKQINNYVEILKDSQIDRRFRKLSRIKSDFQAYPPFWYYYGKSAQDNGNRQLAIECYNRYELIRKGIFRSDPFYSSVAMNRISLLDFEQDKIEILRNLDIIKDQAKNDNNLIMYCAINYLRLKEFSSAIKLLQKNIDEEYKVSLNKRLLGEVLLAQKLSPDFDSLLDEMTNNDEVKNQDIIWLIGRSRQIDLLNKIKDQIENISIIIDDNIIGDSDVYVMIPVKWFFEDLKLQLNYDSKIFEPKEIKTNEEEHLVSCKFESIFNYDNFLKKNETKLITIVLDHPSYPLNVIFQMEPKEKKVDSIGGKVAKFEYTPKWIKKKMNEHDLDEDKSKIEIIISLVEIRSANESYILENDHFAKK